MKIFNILFLMTSLLFISSCGDDPSSEELIQGTWELTTLSRTGCTNFNDNGNTVYGDAGCVESQFGPVCLTGSMVFLAPSSLTLTQTETTDGAQPFTDVTTGTYSFEGNTEDEMTICFSDECVEGTLSVSESSFTWIGFVESEGCNISFTGFK